MSAPILDQLIVMARNSRGDEFPIRVPLPLDDGARRLIERQFEGLVGLVLSAEDKTRFLAEIAYLPAEFDTLAWAKYIYATQGCDWHTACQRARIPE